MDTIAPTMTSITCLLSGNVMAAITLDIVPQFDKVCNSFFLALEPNFSGAFYLRHNTKEKTPNWGEREKSYDEKD